MTSSQGRQLALLKSALYRLTSTSTKQLPSIAAHVSSSLIDCRELIGSEKQTAKDGQVGIAIQKLKTVVSAFLNDKTLEKRWTAVVLIKALVDVGQSPVLQACSGWIQGLAAILKRNDPPTTKRLAIIVLTKIFLLTQEHPALIRELTTPALPQFITQCLNVAFPKGEQAPGPPLQLQITVLDCFAELLPNHPSIFRTFVSQIQSKVRPLLVSSSVSSDATRSTAQSLYTLLPITAPKNASSNEWSKLLDGIIEHTHNSLDQIFRTVVEDWKSDTGYRMTETGSFQEDPQCAEAASIHLPAWSGIYEGCGRVNCLLELLASFVTSHMPDPVSFPIGRLIDLLTRAFGITAPAVKPSHRQRDAYTQDEREALYSQLPHIHTSALYLIECMIDRFRQSVMPLYMILVQEISGLFAQESFHGGVRQHSYRVASRLLEACGPATSAAQTKPLRRIILQCCKDIVPDSQASDETSTTSILGPAKISSRRERPDAREPLLKAAKDLLTIYVSKVPARNIPPSVRQQIDRTAILSQDSRAMLASVLNPPTTANGSDKVRNSIMPFLAQAHPELLEVEGVLRPRMPVVPIAAPALDSAPTDSAPQSTHADPNAHSMAGPHSSDDDMESEDLDSSRPSSSHGQQGTASPFAPPPRLQPAQPQLPALKRSLSPDRLQQRKRTKKTGKSSGLDRAAGDAQSAARGTADTNAMVAGSASTTRPTSTSLVDSWTQRDGASVTGDDADTLRPVPLARDNGDLPQAAAQLTQDAHASTTATGTALDDDSDFDGEIPELDLASSSDGES